MQSTKLNALEDKEWGEQRIKIESIRCLKMKGMNMELDK
jgi:hypothetical protein